MQDTMSQLLDDERFKSLVEHSLDAMALIEPDGKVSYVSPAIVRVLGYTPEEFVSLEPFEAVHPSDRDEARHRFAELVGQQGNTQTATNRARHKDGSWRWIETVATNHLQAPSIRAIIANFRDVTDRKRAENTLREDEEKFRFIVESATEFAIFTTDLDGRVNGWNSGASRLLGYDETEIIGQDCRIFFTPEDNAEDEPEKEMHDALLQGSGNDEKWHVRKDGSHFWGSGLMMPLRDDAGNTHGYLKIFRDMTREKLAEEALKESDRRKDEFLGMLAHELRNPLSAISNAARLLHMPGSEHNLQWSQRVIERQSKHLARLLDDLLDISRITQGKIRLVKERLDFAPVIARAVEAVRPLIEQKKHSLTLSMSPGAMSVFGDPTRLEQVLVNLLINAIKYTDEGGRISVTAQGGKEAVIAVQDTGVGIAPEMLPRIFELFVQVDRSLDRSQGGLGIGLTLARSLVEMHGGKIVAKSDGPGKGSEFTISLPIADEHDRPHEEDDREPSASAREGFRVLVVDDNEDAAISLGRLLTNSGYEVTTAYDGHSAIEAARAECPDAILMDIGLPGIDGHEIARRLRQEGACKESALIAISGYGQEEDRRRSLEAGFDHHFVKPVDYDSLRKVLAGYAASSAPPVDDSEQGQPDSQGTGPN